MAAPRLVDRVKETVTTEGTGSYTVGALPATGFLSVTSGFANGETGIFYVEDGEGGYELFVGTYTSPSTLARTTILKSSNSNLAVSWAPGNKTLACGVVASRADLVRMKHNLAAGAAPTVNDDSDDGYHVGSRWIYGAREWVCTTETVGAAAWKEVLVNLGTNTGALAVGIGAAATDGYTVAFGHSASATGYGSTSVGSSASASGANSAAIASATCAGDHSVAVGLGAIVQATSENSVVVGPAAQTGTNSPSCVLVGYQATTNIDSEGATVIGRGAGVGFAFATAVGFAAYATARGAVALGSGGWAGLPNSIMHSWDDGVSFGADCGHFLQYAQTTDATPTYLQFYRDAVTYGELDIIEGYSYTFTGIVSARSATDAKSWKVEGMVKRNTGGNIALVGTPTVTEIGEDAGATTWALAVSVNVGTQSLRFDVTGAAATTINWTGRFNTITEYFY
jgi:hypothetical protein